MKCPICSKDFNDIKFHLNEHTKEDLIEVIAAKLRFDNKDRKILRNWEFENMINRYNKKG